MSVKKSTIVFICCLGFALGVLSASFTDLPKIRVVLLLPLMGLLLFKKRALLWTVSLALLFLILGIIRQQAAVPQVNENFTAFYNGRQAVFEATVTREPDNRLDQTKLTLGDLVFLVDGEAKRIKGKILLTAKLYPEYHYGDRLGVKCGLKKPEPVEGFAYDRYLAKEKIYSLCYRPKKIELVGMGHGSGFKNLIFDFKRRATEAIGGSLSEPHASFLAGILWGARSGLPQEVMDNFNRAGLSHILAVSGYNISVIVVFLQTLCFSIGLNRKRAFMLMAAVIFAFVLFTGFSSSVVRAAIMGFLVLLAKNYGRLIAKRNLLALTMSAMLLVNPMILLYDAGFQLSFLAVAGLMYFAEPIKKFFKFLPDALGLRENLSATLSATLATLPIIIWNFGRVSVAGLLANLLVLPVIPFAMLLGFMLLIFSMVSQPVAAIFGWIVWLPLEYVLAITKFLSSFGWSVINLSV